MNMDMKKVGKAGVDSGQLQQREAELDLISSVQQGLLAKKEMKDIYELVGDRLRDLFDAQVTGIYTFDHDSDLEHFQYLFEDGERLFPESRPLNQLRKYIIRNKGVLLINEDADATVERITGEKHEAVPGTRLPQALLFVPLMMDDRVTGCLSLQNLDREHAFRESDVQLLSTLANSISIALENARYFSETEQRNAELAVINSVQEGLVAEMDMQGIYDLVGEKVRELFDAQGVIIATLDHHAETERFYFALENGERFYPEPRPFDKIRQRLIRTKKMIWVNENFAEAYTTITGEAPKAVPGTLFPKSAVFVPLLIGDMVRGYVSLQIMDREHAFSEADVRLLNTLANSMSVALENARLFSETEQRNTELAVINSVQEGLVAEMDMQGIYNLVGERIREVFDAQVAGIVTFNIENRTEHFAYAFEDGDRLYPSSRPYDKVRDKIIKERKTLLFNENAAGIMSEINGEPHKPVPGTRVAKSALYVPMVVGEAVKGYVTLQNLDREQAFSEADVRLLNTLVNSMSVALENARLFNETEQRNAELAVINSVQEGLVAEMDLQGIYDLVGDKIRDLFDSQVTVIATLDQSSHAEHFHYVFEDGQRFYPDPRSYDGLRETLIQTHKLIHINENALEVIKQFGASGKPAPGTRFPKSMVYVPLVLGDVVRGYVSLQNLDRDFAFSESDVRLLSTLANSMSVALENARLFNETEQRLSELHTVNNISRAMVSQLELDALIDLVGEQMKKTFKADIVYIALYDRDKDTIFFPYEYGDKNEPRKFGDGFTERIITSNKPLLINKDIAEIRDQLKAKQIGRVTSSFLGVPIKTGDMPNGVISVQSTEEENRFDENDLRLLSTIAANVSVFLQNAEAYQKLSSALDDLRAAQEQLVQQEKLASLGQLTAGIAHEIKNPLNFVNNFSDVSLEMIDEALEELQQIGDNKHATESAAILADIKSNLAKIHEHGTRADGIVKSMLQHSRGGSGKMEPTDLNGLVKEYVNLAFHGMRAGKNPINVDIDLQVDESIGNVPMIAEDFSRVILNLCNNAFDAMGEKGKVESGKLKVESGKLKVERGKWKVESLKGKVYAPTLTVRTKSTNGNILVEIEDNGPGIPDDIKDKILQPFFTTKKGTQGTGLGLSITNDIVKAHGGKLMVESKKEEGTAFIIQLPNKHSE